MSQDQERTKALLALKQRLEKRTAELEEELAEIKVSLEAVNTIILEKGFKRGNLKETEAQPKTEVAIREPPSEGYKGGEPENVIPLKTVTDESLAIIYVENNAVHVLPDESKRFSVNTPPFTSFLVERVLTRMQEKDSELVRLKQLAPEKMFAYSIIQEDDLIREIVIKNVDEERLKELKSSIRWTLEKMYEKMKN